MLFLTDDMMRYNEGCMFSTRDKDNDELLTLNIATKQKAPWWFCIYYYVTLTGLYGDEITSGSGIRWFGPWGYTQYAKYVVMSIRPN